GAKVRSQPAEVPKKEPALASSKVATEADADTSEIPIHELEYEPIRPAPVYVTPVASDLPWDEPTKPQPPEPMEHPEHDLPSTELLHEAPGKSAYDSLELKDIAVRIKSSSKSSTC